MGGLRDKHFIISARMSKADVRDDVRDSTDEKENEGMSSVFNHDHN